MDLFETPKGLDLKICAFGAVVDKANAVCALEPQPRAFVAAIYRVLLCQLHSDVVLDVFENDALPEVVPLFRARSLSASRLLGSQNSRKFGNIVPGDFTPVLAKHSKSFNLIDTLAVGVDRIQRNFEPMQRQVEYWRQAQIADERAKLILYAAFVDGKLEAPRSLLPEVHRLYFEPQYEEFSPRTMWSLSNAFTSAFKKLDPVPQFKATAKLGEFLNQLPA